MRSPAWMFMTSLRNSLLSRKLFTAAGADHPFYIAFSKPAAVSGISLTIPDIRQAVGGEIPHNAALLPIGTALQHAAIIKNVNLLHQPPAPGKRLQFVFANRGVPDILLIGPVFHRFDIQFDLPILPVAAYAGNLVVGLNGIDHNDFKPR